MKNITQAQAALKIREAMSGLLEAKKTATPKERKVIHACMCELRQIRSDLSAQDALPPPAYDEEAKDEEEEDEEESEDDVSLSYDEEDKDDKAPFEGAAPPFKAEGDVAAEGEDDLEGEDEDAEGDEDMDEMGEDEELALSALELAASALKAAKEEDEASKEDEDEDEEVAAEDEKSEEDKEEDEDVAALPEEEESDEDEVVEGDDEDLEEDDEEFVEGEDDLEESDDEVPADDIDAVEGDVDVDGDGVEDDDEDSEEILSEDELKALEDEGLLEGKVNKDIAKRLSNVRARLTNLFKADVGDAGDVLDPAGAPAAEEAAAPIPEKMPNDYEEDAEEAMTTAEYHAFMASLTSDERRELRRADVLGTDISAKKMPQAVYNKMKRTAKKNRKRRKFRSVVKKSAKGKKASVTLPGGKRKSIKKHFFFSTYDAKGNFLGTFWLAAQKINKDTAKAYLEKHGVKHPGVLPKVDPEKKWGAARKKAAAAKKV